MTENIDATNYLTANFEFDKFKPELPNLESLWLNKCKREEGNFELRTFENIGNFQHTLKQDEGRI